MSSSRDSDENFRLKDPEEQLFRQVHPNFVRDGRPSGQAFRPTKKDESKLSVSRSALTTAKAAFELYTQKLELASFGVWAISVGECGAEGLAVLSDPLESPPSKVADPSHAVVDFSGISNSQADARGLRLRRRATERGCLYSPNAASDTGDK